MKRWGIGFLAVLLACLPLFLSRASDSSLLRDSDTAYLLQTIRERQDPLAWFSGDWPLKNHFYRPISTLFFEMDNVLYGDQAWGYGLTNVLLCVACVLLLFWFLREATDSPIYATAGSLLFASWHGWQPRWDLVCLGLSGVALAAGIRRHGTAIRGYVPALLVLAYLPVELFGRTGLHYRMVGWIPGRTASVMTVFALIAMAAYARYERTSASRLAPAAPGPLDPPATRSFTVATGPARGASLWLGLAVLASALAMGAYEQAVMLPAALLGVAVLFSWQRYQVRWGAQILFWGVLLGYLFLRWKLLPADTSGYQKQQLRDGPGVWISVLDYVMPNLSSLIALDGMVSAGPLILMTSGPYQMLLGLASNAWAFFEARRAWRFAVAGWGLSILAFLPMAWVKHFDHYEYWPMALRAMAVVALAKVALDLFLSACSPPTVQAPPRSSPAPGSLPRP